MTQLMALLEHTIEKPDKNRIMMAPNPDESRDWLVAHHEAYYMRGRGVFEWYLHPDC